jgi:hypothetical protein
MGLLSFFGSAKVNFILLPTQNVLKRSDRNGAAACDHIHFPLRSGLIQVREPVLSQGRCSVRIQGCSWTETCRQIRFRVDPVSYATVTANLLRVKVPPYSSSPDREA